VGQHTFGRNEKLKRRKIIDSLFSSGKSIRKFPLLLQYSMVPLPENVAAQVTFTVSKRAFKKAVDRNRIKRLMREAYRLNKSDHIAALEAKKEQVAMMFVYLGKEKPEFALVEEKIKTLLARFSSDVPNSQKHEKK
jgi:ribonuclease P protein component